MKFFIVTHVFEGLPRLMKLKLNFYGPCIHCMETSLRNGCVRGLRSDVYALWCCHRLKSLLTMLRSRLHKRNIFKRLTFMKNALSFKQISQILIISNHRLYNRQFTNY